MIKKFLVFLMFSFIIFADSFKVLTPNESRTYTGKGVFTFAIGDSYKGDWLNGKRNGFGVYVWSNGNKYIGNWANDKLSGNIWNTGNIYQGNFSDDKKMGLVHFFGVMEIIMKVIS